MSGEAAATAPPDEDGSREVEELLRGLEQYRDRVAALLPQMYSSRHPRLNSTLALAHRAGHTLDALGVVVGVTRECIRQRIAAGDPPVIQEPFKVSAEVVAELLALRAGAEGRNPAKREATARYRAFLADLRRQGAGVSYLASLLDVTHGAVQQQLRLHKRDEGFTDA